MWKFFRSGKNSSIGHKISTRFYGGGTCVFSSRPYGRFRLSRRKRRRLSIFRTVVLCFVMRTENIAVRRHERRLLSCVLFAERGCQPAGHVCLFRRHYFTLYPSCGFRDFATSVYTKRRARATAPPVLCRIFFHESNCRFRTVPFSSETRIACAGPRQTVPICGESGAALRSYCFAGGYSLQSRRKAGSSSSIFGKRPSGV